jgi:hypothetical protein
VIPAEDVVAQQPHHDERGEEADEPDRQGRLPFTSELLHVHLGAGQERQHDPGERPDEGQPARDVEVERVSDHDAEKQLD